MQHSLNVYHSVYTSLHVFIQLDKGKSVGKLLKHLMSTFIKKGTEKKKKKKINAKGLCTNLRAGTLKHSHYLSAA